MKKITLSGSPKDIGIQHGSTLSDLIHQNIDFYKKWFLLHLGSEEVILQKAAVFKDKITAFNPEFSIEIDHIAIGAEISEPLWLYALNSRTELVVTENPNECTAIVFPGKSLIGQTWDWAEFLKDKFVIMEIEFPSGHKIMQLTEAGIIGKIGLNNKGIGQTLNILRLLGERLDGVPIHIVMRAVLESTSLEEALIAIKRSGHGKASNLILAQGGKAFNIEFAGSQTHSTEIKEDFYIHTNHYNHARDDVRVPEDSYINSLHRYTAAVNKSSKVENYSTQNMISILSDRSNNDHPILDDFAPFSFGGIGNCGTLATIVMELDKLRMNIRAGNPSSSSFSLNNFTSFQLSK